MQKFRNRKGFTLIELMIVVVIIGILAALAIPRFGNTSRAAKQSEAESVLKQVHTLQEAHWERWSQYASALPPATPATAANLMGWEDPGAKYFTFTVASPSANTYCATATPTATAGAGLQIMHIRVANKLAATPAETDGKPQFGACP